MKGLRIGFQRVDRGAKGGGGVGILAVKGLDDPLADHAAVFIVGLGQQQDELGHAASGGDIPPPQVFPD